MACGPRVEDRKMRLLVVDDWPGTAETMAIFFRLAGHEVFTAMNGREAIALADKHSPHAVILDLAMPIMGGEEVARRLRVTLPDAVLIAVAARVPAEINLFHHHFTKPADPFAVLECLNKQVCQAG